MRTSFHGELEQIETALQDEGVLVQAALRSTLEALARQDTELADRVIEADDEVDRRYLELETAVESLLARQTPVAVDLRLVLAVLFVNLHLERMADYCVTIAKLTKLTEDLGVHDDDLVDSLVEMGSRAEHMIRVAVDSFANRDLERAESLVRLDDLINQANRRVAEEVLALGDAAAEREYGLRMLVVSRCIERIGDHAVDIGEQTAYLISGQFREFTDASHPALRER